MVIILNVNKLITCITKVYRVEMHAFQSTDAFTTSTLYMEKLIISLQKPQDMHSFQRKLKEVLADARMWVYICNLTIAL